MKIVEKLKMPFMVVLIVFLLGVIVLHREILKHENARLQKALHTAQQHCEEIKEDARHD